MSAFFIRSQHRFHNYVSVYRLNKQRTCNRAARCCGLDWSIARRSPERSQVNTGYARGLRERGGLAMGSDMLQDTHGRGALSLPSSSRKDPSAAHPTPLCSTPLFPPHLATDHVPSSQPRPFHLSHSCPPPLHTHLRLSDPSPSASRMLLSPSPPHIHPRRRHRRLFIP